MIKKIKSKGIIVMLSFVVLIVISLICVTLITNFTPSKAVVMRDFSEVKPTEELLPSDYKIDGLDIDFDSMVMETISQELKDLMKSTIKTNFNEQIKLGKIHSQYEKNAVVIAKVQNKNIYDYELETKQINDKIRVRSVILYKKIDKDRGENQFKIKDGEEQPKTNQQLLQELIDNKLILLDCEKLKCLPSIDNVKKRVAETMKTLNDTMQSGDEIDAKNYKQTMTIFGFITKCYGYNSIDEYYENFGYENEFVGEYKNAHETFYLENNKGKIKDDYINYVKSLSKNYKIQIFVTQ